MDNSKSVVILYASAGHGHQKAAQGILEAYREAAPDQHVRAFDTLLYAHTLFGELYKQSYYLMIKHAPWMWGLFYHSTDHAWIAPLVRLVRRIVNSLVTRKLENLLTSENPGVIVSTHFLSTEVASHLKNQGRIQSKIITVVTDYMPHTVWIGSHVDHYVVALEETKADLVGRGVPKDKINVLGIPVEHKFLLPHSRQEVCQKLGIRQDLFTVLITSGGAGIGAIQKIAEGLLALDHPIQVLAVCGTNGKLHDDLIQQSLDNALLKPFGFVDNMDELMTASDVVIGKGGGLTITESFVKGKPVILFRSVPGQETRNAVCIQEHGAGFATSSVATVIGKVLDFLQDPSLLDVPRKKIQRMTHSKASQDIVHLAKASS